MDPFTESLLERTRARSENLAKKMNQVSPRKRRTPLTDANFSENEEKKVRLEASPVKSALRGYDMKPDTPAIPSVRLRMTKLADIRKAWDADGKELDSPQNVPAPRPREIEPEPVESTPRARKSRFAALAASINSWEDDLDHPKHDYYKEEKPQTRKWECPKPVEEPTEDLLRSKISSKIQSVKTEKVSISSQQVTPKKPARNVRFEDEAAEEDEEEQVKPVIGNGQGKAQMRSLPAASTKQDTHALGDPKIGKPEAKAELRSLQSNSPAKSGSAVSRLIEERNTETGKNRAELRSVPGGSPARKRIQVSLSREREPSKLDFQKLCQQQPVPTPRAAPATTTTQRKSPTKRLAPQPAQAVKKQAVESGKNGKAITAGTTDVKAYFGRHKSNAPPSSPKKVDARVGAMAKSIQDRLKQHQENWQCNDINKKIQEQRKKELDIIKQRWNHSSKDTDPEEVRQEREQPKPKPRVTITASEPEPEALMDESREEQDDMEITEDTINIGMMESPPHVSSSEEEEEEEEEEEMVVPRVEAVTKISQEEEEEKGPATPLPPPRPRRTSSKLLAEEEAKAKQEAVINHPRPKPEQDDSEYEDDEDEDVDISDVLGDIDDLLNEAEEAMEAEKTPEKMIPQKTETPAPEQKQIQPTVQQAPAQKPPTGGITRSKPSTSQSPNLYSIESFRKHGPKSPSASVSKSIIRSDSGTVAAGQGVKPMALKPIPVKEQIQTLMEEVSAQQSIIYQTSQALNLIASNAEYKGTMQEVEAERLLLIAAQRRQACLAEIQRLKTPSPTRGPDTMQTSDGEVMKACKGFVSLQDIRLPLKTEYILSSKQDRMCHYYFLLLRCREHVLATHIQTTVDGVSGDCMPFTNTAKFNNLDSDFVVEVFVFEMQNKRPKADEKTKQNFFSGLTPKKILANMSKDTKQGSKLPTNPSPGGPGSIRASSFMLVGATRLGLQSFRVNRFTLSKVPFNSPLEGTVHMKMSCHTNTNVSESGFLTMFDDISGFGAWHRRWCVLSGGYISYWKYPDDENHKSPMGTIDLRQCITNEVALIPRILCARPNTFELVTRQQATNTKNHQKDTLVTKHEDSVVTTKHMLSADIKEDRLRWIYSLNKTLLDLRTWNRDSARPSSSS